MGELVLRGRGGIRLEGQLRRVFEPTAVSEPTAVFALSEVSVLLPDSWDGERGVSARWRWDASEECLDCSYVNSFQNKVWGRGMTVLKPDDICIRDAQEQLFLSCVAGEEQTLSTRFAIGGEHSECRRRTLVIKSGESLVEHEEGVPVLEYYLKQRKSERKVCAVLRACAEKLDLTDSVLLASRRHRIFFVDAHIDVFLIGQG